MTMHLLRGVSTLNTRRRKFCLTKKKAEEWREDWAKYNRDLRRQGAPITTWEQYQAIRLGTTPAPKTQFRTLQTQPGSHPRYQDRTEIPSLNSALGDTKLRERPQYTGTEIIGIAVLHKSCLQPVSSPEAAKEVARMRRN
jgi:hypothetical protein